MTAKEKQPQVLYRDERGISDLHAEVARIVSQARRIADFWNAMPVPPMNKQIMARLMQSNAIEFDDLLWEFVRTEAVRVHGERYGKTLNRQAHNLSELYDHKAMTGLMNGLALHRERYQYVRMGYVDFDGDGLPFIDADGVKQLEERFIAYDTPENRKRFQVWENITAAIKAVRELESEMGLPGKLLTGKPTVAQPMLRYGNP